MWQQPDAGGWASPGGSNDLLGVAGQGSSAVGILRKRLSFLDCSLKPGTFILYPYNYGLLLVSKPVKMSFLFIPCDAGSARPRPRWLAVQ